MIDSGASGNFISTSTVTRFEIATLSKEHGYELMAVDGSALPGVTKETVPLQLVTQSHHEDIIFDVVEMANHHIVLGNRLEVTSVEVQGVRLRGRLATYASAAFDGR
jgi:hypothetical protein